jgi:hypothetical protein
MADYKKQTRNTNKNTQDLVGAQYVTIDGSSTLVTLGTSGLRLIRVVINTKGLSLNIRSGSRVIGTIGTAVVEGTFMYGVYCDSGIQVDVGGSGGSVTLVYAS